MTAVAIAQLLLFVIVLTLFVKPLGGYMARVYQGEPCGLDRGIGWIERGCYRLAGIDPNEEMGWKKYAAAMLVFNLLGLLAVYGLQRAQHRLPLNPEAIAAVSPDLAFNTAVSYATNTNWQAYSGESTLSYLSQMLGLTVQNFVSAATGMAMLVALIRGITHRSATTLGSFWVDLTRSTLYILMPLSIMLALAQVSQGVVQTLRPYETVNLVEPTIDADGQVVTTQRLALGPAASQIAIKQLGTNGGGFFGVNSAHPFENSAPLCNFLECLAILILPAALCYTFGLMVGDVRQGWAIYTAMLLIFVGLLGVCYWAEQTGNPMFVELGVDERASAGQGGGNMEGKEVRFGVAASALWATVTTAASNGAVNSMHDSYTPLGGLVPMWLMQLGEVVFGGVGSGLYGMLMFAIIAVFIAGLMVGRTPEYLGKKIEAYEMKMASLVILFPPLVVLGFTALAVVTPAGTATISNPGAHGLSQVLYAFSSAGNNNGSAFAGLGANNVFYNLTTGIAMLVSRYWLAVPVLAIAGSLANKKFTPPGSGTLPTHTPLFVVMLIGVVIVVGALTFIPALALEPIVEHLLMLGY